MGVKQTVTIKHDLEVDIEFKLGDDKLSHTINASIMQDRKDGSLMLRLLPVARHEQLHLTTGKYGELFVKVL